MKSKQTGNVYLIELEHDQGHVFAELFDYSDIDPFSGLLVKTYIAPEIEGSLFQFFKEKINRENVFLGPVPLNKSPSLKGKYMWKFLGKINDTKSADSPYFKKLRGIIIKSNDWSELSPWFKAKYLEKDFEERELDYSELRELETLILNHPDMVKTKCTMLSLIRKDIEVQKYYDLNQIENKNMYIQVINTYCSKPRVEELLKKL